MSDIKVSEVFAGKSRTYPMHWSDDHVRAAEHAINNHDRLVEENEQLKTLNAMNLERCDHKTKSIDRLLEENEKLKTAIKNFYKACETENETEVQSAMETMMSLVSCLELTNTGE